MQNKASMVAVILVLAAACAAGATAVGKTSSFQVQQPGVTQEALRPGVWPVASGSKPFVMDLAGQRLGRWTTASTVGSALATWGFVPSPLDQVAPSPTASLQADGEVQVLEIRQRLSSREIAIPYQTTTQPDPNLYAGFSHLLAYGQDGLASEQIMTTFVDGKAVSDRVLSTKVVRPPSDAVMAIGTLHVLYRGGSPLRFSKVENMVSTGYYPSPTWSNGYTATGVRATFGVVAVDPRVIPLGTRLYIPGYGYALAADTGGAIVGNRIDLCFDSEQQALDWGVRDIQVYILN